ncbi:beta-galactosidase [Natronosporangium hydrolyticum]|uniref:Beta-galactosidase n=1 Tax=Natronosporangium hydrolyticum TaxID=2811111 RepID=A0A895YNW9_9ACTN|nr:beta-galactosidase [Natronosporangium hydrolyticum]QSB16406.1 beta-galactosidase [Natronosporangium hydrolyticum]
MRGQKHWPATGDRWCFGGDWNPEQWPEPVWREDVSLMREAGVNLVSVGVFSWSWLEPEPGRYTFDWLDRALELLHTTGIRANLATPTASPPPWFSLAHPDALPVRADGVRLRHGSRDTYCVAAPAYRSAARSIAQRLADRYADHPALAMWHIHNEYGTGCHCDHAAVGFRAWLAARYGDLTALNDAWGTAFWGQHYSDWAQIEPPRATQYLSNPHQLLDFRRYLSDELLAACCEQRDLLRRANPDAPVTTNFPVGAWVPVDHRRWAAELDLVALDAYPEGVGIEAEQQTALLADLARHWAGGRPWLLMEQSPGGLGEHGVQVSKAPGRMARLSTSHLARGSRGVMFFQWRASAAGAEQYHSAMVPHAGPASRIFAEVRELGALLPRLAEAEVGAVQAEVGIGWDAASWWALQAPHLPSPELDYWAALSRAHAALWTEQVTTDFADLAGDLRGYRLILIPSHYLASDAVIETVRNYVAGGGHLVVWYFSGVADQAGRVRLGGYPGAFREVLGVRVTEFQPLPAATNVALTGGTEATRWSELVQLTGAQPVLRYASGPLTGEPAVTRHRYGEGTAWYVSTELSDDTYHELVRAALAAAGVDRGGAPPGVEVVERRADQQRWRFLLNHTDGPATVPADGVDLVTGATVTGAVTIPAGGLAVVRSDGS